MIRDPIWLSSWLALIACALIMGNTRLFAFGDAVIPYKTTPTRTLSIHLYKPTGWRSSQMNPAIVLWHGGGWQSPNLSQFDWLADYFRDRGIVAILAEYRVGLVDATKVESAILDARSAMRFIKANSTKYGIDPARIIAAGGSAGGHLAFGCAMFNSFPPEPDDPAGISPTPAAIVSFNPVVDTTLPDGFGPGYFANNPIFGSPIDQVRADLPPSIVMHGTADSTVPIAQASAFVTAMRARGNDIELVSYTDQIHAFFNSEPYRTITAVRTVYFLEKKGLTGSLSRNNLEQWRYQNFGASANLETGSDTEDPDFDGRANLLEYAFGNNPQIPDSAASPILAKPVGDVTRLDYTHRDDPSLRLNLMGSSDLTVWQTYGQWNGTTWTGSMTYQVGRSPGFISVKLDVAGSAGAPAPRFWKMVASYVN